jgi:3-phosphoshikimate 1-carboxyvinyltransferase
MKVTVHKSDVKGKVNIPSSKSLTIRGLMCAALSKGVSEIVHPLESEDTNAAADVLGQIGVRVQKEGDIWRAAGGSLRVPRQDLYCGESATTLRFMMAICSLIPGRHRLVGGPSLSKRPVKSLVEALKKLGINGSMEKKTTPPVVIEGGTLRGEATELPGHISSQFISALLLIAPFTPKEMSIRLTSPMTSRPYVLMTLWCLKKFGINVRREAIRFVVPRQRYLPTRLEVEGDWSSASYFLALGAFSEEGVTVENLSTATLQGDRVILDLLRRMGATVRVAGNAITVSQGTLKAIRADLTDCIDLLPTVAVLAALADGKSELTGIERARIKESNRVAGVREGLQKLGVDVSEDTNRLTIIGLKTPKKVEEGQEEEEAEKEKGAETAIPQPPVSVLIDSHSDHRIAMAFSMFGAAEGGIVIDGAECVAKTFPGFWESFQGVGGELEKNV